MITFLTAVVGLSITGFTLMFSASAYARLSSVAAIGVAGIVVGGLVTAQLNGGRPYGYDLPVGLDQWRNVEPGSEEAPAKPEQPRQRHKDGAPMV